MVGHVAAVPIWGAHQLTPRLATRTFNLHLQQELAIPGGGSRTPPPTMHAWNVSWMEQRVCPGRAHPQSAVGRSTRGHLLRVPCLFRVHKSFACLQRSKGRATGRARWSCCTPRCPPGRPTENSGGFGHFQKIGRVRWGRPGQLPVHWKTPPPSSCLRKGSGQVWVRSAPAAPHAQSTGRGWQHRCWCAHCHCPQRGGGSFHWVRRPSPASGTVGLKQGGLLAPQPGPPYQASGVGNGEKAAPPFPRGSGLDPGGAIAGTASFRCTRVPAWHP